MNHASVLLITDLYLPLPSSNGACLSRLAAALRAEGHSVTVLSLYQPTPAEPIDGVPVFSLEIQRTHVSLARKLFGFLDDTETVRRLVESAAALNEQYRFTHVVGCYRPIESVMAAEQIARRLGLAAAYLFFDLPLSSGMAAFKQRLVLANYRRLYRRLAKSGRLIAFKFYRAYFEKALGSRTPITYIGTPSYLPQDPPAEPKNDTVELVYTGSFYETIRNPEGMLERLLCVTQSGAVLHLYSWGCEEIVARYKPLYGDSLVLHGKVPLDEANHAMARADVLINLSNRSDHQVPGKIMEYFSLGKPVISFEFLPQDPGEEDYRAYPLIRRVRLDQPADEAALLAFVRDNAHRRVSLAERQTLFADSTPTHLAALILS